MMKKEKRRKSSMNKSGYEKEIEFENDEINLDEEELNINDDDDLDKPLLN